MRVYLFFLLFIPFVSFAQTDKIATILRSKIDHESENPIHSILIQIENSEHDYRYKNGFGTKDNNLSPVTGNEQFKIASSTKLFVATIILQLIEEKKLDLDDTATTYVEHLNYLDFDNFHIYNEKKYAHKITIQQLLSHRTGLADIFTDKEQDFFERLLNNPNKQYTPKSIVALFFEYNLNQMSHFEPDKGWYYSDMNYILLGLIIEQIEQVSLAESIRNRILEPLNMKETYFEYYENPVQKNDRIPQYIGRLDFTEINTSFDWSGGGLVSTNSDLVTFIKALFDLKLIDQQSLNKMMDVKFSKENESRYGLGVYESIYNGKTYYGHYGFYGTYVGYCPETKTAISYAISQATTDFDVHGLIREILLLTE